VSGDGARSDPAGVDGGSPDYGWREVNARLEAGLIDWRQALDELFERGLIRKALGITPARDPEQGQHVVFVLEIARDMLVPGPRLLHAIEDSIGYGARGGRIYRPVSDRVLWDTGAFSTEFPHDASLAEDRTEDEP